MWQKAKVIRVTGEDSPRWSWVVGRDIWVKAETPQKWVTREGNLTLSYETNIQCIEEGFAESTYLIKKEDVELLPTFAADVPKMSVAELKACEVPYA